MWQAPSQLLLSFSSAWRKILSVGHLLHCDSINEGTGKNCLIYYSEWQFAVWGRLTQEHIHLKPWCQAEGAGSIGYQCNQCDALCFQQFYKKKKKQYKFYFNFQSFKTCSRLTKISTSIEIIPWGCSHLDHKSPHPGSEGPPAVPLAAAHRHAQHAAGAQSSAYSRGQHFWDHPKLAQMTLTWNQRGSPTDTSPRQNS